MSEKQIFTIFVHLKSKFKFHLKKIVMYIVIGCVSELLLVYQNDCQTFHGPPVNSFVGLTFLPLLLFIGTVLGRSTELHLHKEVLGLDALIRRCFLHKWLKYIRLLYDVPSLLIKTELLSSTSFYFQSWIEVI